MSFETWLATLLKVSEAEIRHLLHDQTATQFLITWSLFESKCFGGYARLEDIDTIAERLIKQGAWSGSLKPAAEHFYKRYQDKDLLRTLLYKQKCGPFLECLRKPFEVLSQQEILFLLLVTVYRYRNNIFHGNKGVKSWLLYEEQIKLCSQTMQTLISHEEKLKPSLAGE